MAKSSKTNKKKRPHNPQPRKICSSCPAGREKQLLSNFYLSKNPFHADGHVPMCKTCIFEYCYDPVNNQVDLDRFKDVLRQVDRPFISSVWKSSVEEYQTSKSTTARSKERKIIISIYFKNINSLTQYKTLTWADGEGDQPRANEGLRKPSPVVPVEDHIPARASFAYPEQKANDEEPKFYLSDDRDYVPSDDVIRKFGSGFAANVYRMMENKYNELKVSYPQFTTLHDEALCSYVRLKVQEEVAIANGDIDAVAKWSAAATRAAEKAKINPSQLKKSDLEGGINSFSELTVAIEQAVDVVPILPRFRQRPNDVPDFIIWCYINYMRDLEGKPKVEYEEVYKFYDERKAEFIARFGDPDGIFSADHSAEFRDAIKDFIKLPDDYDADADEDGDVLT